MINIIRNTYRNIIEKRMYIYVYLYEMMCKYVFINIYSCTWVLFWVIVLIVRITICLYRASWWHSNNINDLPANFSRDLRSFMNAVTRSASHAFTRTQFVCTRRCSFLFIRFFPLRNKCNHDEFPLGENKTCRSDGINNNIHRWRVRTKSERTSRATHIMTRREKNRNFCDLVTTVAAKLSKHIVVELKSTVQLS